MQTVTEHAAESIADLERWGMAFARERDGRISQRFFGAHTYRRTAFAGDYTGLELQRTWSDVPPNSPFPYWIPCTSPDFWSATT